MSFLAAAFISVWLLVMLYLVFVGTRQRKLEEEVAGLVEEIEERLKVED